MIKFDAGNGWDATVTGKQPDEQVFLRKSFNGAQVVICVGLDGYDYNRYTKRVPEKWQKTTRGKNINIAMNGAVRLTFNDFDEMTDAIKRAQMYLYGILPV